MITESEFVMIRQFDRTLGRAVDDAQTIINRKNTELVSLAAQVAALQRELQVERGKRKLAEYRNNLRRN